MTDRVLVLAPHCDDADFGCGGSIARLVEEGNEIFEVAFSDASRSLPQGSPAETLRREFRDAAAVLGVPGDNAWVLSYPVRDFQQYRQAILDDMIRLHREIRPNILMLPSTFDTHQDHQTIAEEGFRAFKHVTMLGYEVPWNNLNFSTQGFIFLEERHLARKLEALACYRSQKERPYASCEFIKAWAITRGLQIGGHYAEAFQVVRSVR